MPHYCFLHNNYIERASRDCRVETIACGSRTAGEILFFVADKENYPKEIRPRKTPTPSLRFSPDSALASTRRRHTTPLGLKHELAFPDSCCDVKGFTNVASAGMRKSDRCSRGVYGGVNNNSFASWLRLAARGDQSQKQQHPRLSILWDLSTVRRCLTVELRYISVART